MPITFIIECNKCSGLLLATIEQKTKTCPYCGTRIDLHRVKRLAKAEDAFLASEMLRQIKSKRQANAKRPRLK
jgi:DNA-directed RNA polymerase subunit RPC12/RpoP